jgi:hypothetical protein
VIVTLVLEDWTAVTSPVLLTVATDGALDVHVTDRDEVTFAPNVSVIVADSCTVVGMNTPVTLRLLVAGATDTLCACPITTTVADPEGSPGAELVAVTVAVPAAVFVAVTTPLVTLATPPVADQINGWPVRTAPAASRVVAVSVTALCGAVA